MKFSWRWLSQLIDLTHIEFNELTKKLILAGFEIEEVHDLPDINDKTIDISITANRNDASYIVGIAREISTILNIPSQYNLNLYNTRTHLNQPINNLNIKTQLILDLKLQKIVGLKNLISPKWLQDYLRGCNIKAVNILRDIEEYIRIKWGQDIEIFDTRNIDDIPINIANITIEKDQDINHRIENYNSSNNTNFIELLKYKNKTLSVIGIKSNEKFTCDNKTSTIIICATICNSEYLGRATKQIKIKTEKSIKQLKQIFRDDFLNAYNEALQLITTFAGGTVGKSYSYHALKDISSTIILHKKTIYNILGPINQTNNYKSFLSVQEILNILRQLHFKPQYNHKQKIFQVLIPKNRVHDIKRSIDVIEEIGRVYGFEKFNNNLPNVINKGRISNNIQILKKVRRTLRDLGLHEVVHYSLQNSYTNKLDTNITLYNPLTEDQSRLQNNLAINLLQTKKHNIKQKKFNIEIFEIGRVFINNTTHEKNYKESIHIAGIMGSYNFSRQSWSHKPQALSWFQAKGNLEFFFERIQAQVCWENVKTSNTQIFSNELINIFHPKRTAIIYNPVTSNKLGIFGQLSNKYNNYYNFNYSTYIFEINLIDLIQTINPTSHLNYNTKPYSTYPSVSRDVSIKLNQNETIELIQKKILNQNNSLIESVEIFNEYQNKENSTKRNIGLRITYRANNRTLNNKDLKRIEKEIKNLLNQ